MTDTIDRIQVEFSTNIREFTTQLSGIESGVGNVAKTFSTVESASQGYTSAMDSTATATTAAVASITDYTAASVTQASAARTAADETESQGRRSAEAFQGIKEGFVQIKTVLGMLGVSVGLGALISQIKQLRAEAEAAGKAYGRMYNTIYYTTGELTGTQKELADSLRLEGFDTTAIAETVARLTALFPDAESTVLETGETALAQMAEEVLWMERKGYGDVSSLIDGMNEAFKKWSVPSGEITGELGYLAAAYRDTNTDVTTLLSSLTRLDEVGRTLGFTFRDMVDFIGAANVAGNLEDLSNVGMRFESQYTARVSDIYQALLDADRETLTLAGLGAEDAGSAILQVVEAMSVDESAAKTKAQELAGTIVTSIFREANREASVAVTQAQASQIWADALDIEVSRMTNRLADLSMSAVRGYENIRTANRDIVAETGQTTTILVKVDKGLGTSDYAAKTEAAKEDALRSTWAGTRTPLVEKRTSAYIDEGKDYWSGYGIANLDVELSRIAAYLLAGTGVLKNLVSGSAEEPAGDAGLLDTISRFFAQLSPVGVASAAEMEPLFNGDISATGDVHLSPAESMAISADSATVVADHVSADTKEVPDVTVDVPDVLVEPAISLNPAITVAPQITAACAAPEVSVYPELSVNPSVIVNPS
ncbi:MAG TPA: hypothetical protein O0X27_06075, partial [Methanocorpusculum sp.]|nr:hypothetical protein [Methanocorpusculum sp.]